MKAILEFSLPEEQVNFDLAVKASEILLALSDFRTWLRSQRKYTELEDLEYKFANKAWDELHRILNERGIEDLL